MAITEDRKFVHDLRNSLTVIRNLSQLLHENKLQGKDKEQAQEFIMLECAKMLELLEKK